MRWLGFFLSFNYFFPFFPFFPCLFFFSSIIGFFGGLFGLIHIGLQNQEVIPGVSIKIKRYRNVKNYVKKKKRTLKITMGFFIAFISFCFHLFWLSVIFLFYFSDIFICIATLHSGLITFGEIAFMLSFFLIIMFLVLYCFVRGGFGSTLVMDICFSILRILFRVESNVLISGLVVMDWEFWTQRNSFDRPCDRIWDQTTFNQCNKQ